MNDKDQPIYFSTEKNLKRWIKLREKKLGRELKYGPDYGYHFIHLDEGI